MICTICKAWMGIHPKLNDYRKCLSCGFTRMEKPMIDWTDPKCKITAHFTVHEAIYLPTWERMANESDGLTEEIKNNLVNLFTIMEKIRDVLGCPINVHCTYRPGPYSVAVGGTIHDVHTLGQAIDLDCNPNMTCDEAKQKLLPLLESMNLRMEDNGNAPWLHLDAHPVIHSRFFKA